MSLSSMHYYATFIYFSWHSFKVLLVTCSSPSNKNNIYFMDATGEDIADYISSKKYIPNVMELPKDPLIKTTDNDATYLLTRLSDEELLKLLNEQPQRNEFTLSDILKTTFNMRTDQENKLEQPGSNQRIPNELSAADSLVNRLQVVNSNEAKALPYFRLNLKPVDTYKGLNDAHYLATQKLKYLLNDYQQSKAEYNDDEELFDTLVAQLKSLCCKKSENQMPNEKSSKTPIDDILPLLFKYGSKNSLNRQTTPIDITTNQYMFLIINDEIKFNGNDELIAVDPDSLAGNSSVLLLGPVTTPLSDYQLKSVMSRISKELAKPEYLSLLRQLSNGLQMGNNKNVMKNFVFGPETRRYIKPHRCNHQSKLAKVYGGPKWLICTGYLNLNKPSLYD